MLFWCLNRKGIDRGVQVDVTPNAENNDACVGHSALWLPYLVSLSCVLIGPCKLMKHRVKYRRTPVRQPLIIIIWAILAIPLQGYLWFSRGFMSQQHYNYFRKKKDAVVYLPYHQLQSHDAEFDYLKSVEIEAHINPIRWLTKCNATNMLLAANDKTIKLWRITERGPDRVANFINTPQPVMGGGGTNMHKPTLSHNLRRAYTNAHAYHINSVSLNSDSESFLSADDLRINLWHLEHNETLNIVDIKPANMEDLTEVITSAAFHPKHCAMFAFCTSKGSIKVGDLRESFNVQNYCKTFEIEEDLANRTFFSEIIGSLSDIQFAHDGRYILARDYLTLKIWDVAMEARPLKVIQIHEGLRPRLCELYENDCIFDKFECSWCAQGNYVVTGSYKNHFKVADISTILNPTNKTKNLPSQVLTFEAAKPKKKQSKLSMRGKSNVQRSLRDDTYEQADFNRKVLHVVAHPHEAEIACAALNNVYVFGSP